MFLRFVGAVFGLVLIAGSLIAFEGEVTLKKVDAENGVLVLGAGGNEKTVKVAQDAKFLDAQGKALTDGLKSKELKEGIQATVTVEREGDEFVLKSLRIGKSVKSPIQRNEGTFQAPATIRRIDLKPLTELGKEKYQGFEGGLYPGGQNERPAAHEAAGLSLAKKVQPLDAQGQPAAEGKIALLTVGMSNTAQASEAFKQLADADKEKNPRLVIVNGAQGGMSANRMFDPEDQGSGTRYWQTVDERLRAARVTREQVQVVWIKQADPGPSQGFPGYARTLQGELAKIVQVLPRRFPNVKLVYLSSRTYGGYAKNRLNPEPYAYESGFSVKWLIEQQLKGEPVLNFDPGKGAVKAPWLSWGPYLWANGSTPRADGFSYAESDFAANDGTHESASGQQKVGRLMVQFFKTDSTTKPWFLGK